MAKLKGETTLVRMHRDYTVEGANKRAAYEIAVGERRNRKQGVIYITKKLVHNGFQYFNDREGYSLLIMFHDRKGRELYGAYVPLQSLKQENGAYLYTTGTKEGPGTFPHPQEPFKPLYALQAAYVPNPLKERTGDAVFNVMPMKDGMPGKKIIAEGEVPFGS